MGSVFVAYRLSCSFACGIFPEKRSNPCSLHWQADSYPLHHQGNPICWIIIDSLYLIVNVVCISKPIVQVIHILKRGSAWHLDHEIQGCCMIYVWKWSRQEKENPLSFLGRTIPSSSPWKRMEQLSPTHHHTFYSPKPQRHLKPGEGFKKTTNRDWSFLTKKKLILAEPCESVQLSSVNQWCPTLCDPIDCTTPGFLVHHQLPELTQIHVHQASDAIQPSHPLSSPSPPTFNLSQHQGLFKWVSSLHQVAKVLEFWLQHQFFQWIFRIDSF